MKRHKPEKEKWVKRINITNQWYDYIKTKDADRIIESTKDKDFDVVFRKPSLWFLFKKRVVGIYKSNAVKLLFTGSIAIYFIQKIIDKLLQYDLWQHLLKAISNHKP